MSDLLAASPVARALGLALVQFVWQGALIGAVTGLALLALRRHTPRARYLTACAGLAIMLIAPIATWMSYVSRPEQAEMAPSSTGDLVIRLEGLQPQSAWPSAAALSGSRPVLDINTLVSPIVMIWMAGVIVLTVRLASGCVAISALRRRTSRPLPDVWCMRVTTLAHRLGVTRRVHAAASSVLDVPTVIGWLRPMILVPASVLAGLPASQLEAVLAHELAHVRRHDYVVNMAQHVVETLLFYHPAVWWVSRRIRTERELCCDDLAVAICGDRLAYAAALVSLEELRPVAPALALAATGGSLLTRIQRLLGTEPRYSYRPSLLSAAVAIGLVVVLLLAGSGGAQAAPIAALHRVPRADIALSTPTASPAVAALPIGPSLPHAAQTPATPSGPVAPRPAQPATAPSSSGSSASQLPPVTLQELLALWESGDRRPRVVIYDENQPASNSPVIQAVSRSPSVSPPAPGRPGNGISNPEPIRRPTPIYTQEAKDRQIMGTVEVEIVVLKDGTVGDVRVVRSLDREFGMDEAAISAAKQWLFKPALDRSGQPVPVIVTLIFDLRLH